MCTRLSLLLLLFTVLVSCGDTKQEKLGSGDLVNGDPEPLTGDEQGRMASICTAIRHKTNILDSESRKFAFKFSEIPCGETKAKTEDITVSIDDSRNSEGEMIYTFKPQNGKSYPFKEIETTDTGVMRKICESVTGTDPQRPIFTDASKSKAIWFYLTSSDECVPDENHSCLTVRYGSLSEEGQNYSRHTSEVMRFRTTAHVNRGYYLSRQKVTNVGCSEGTVTFKTVLK
jgi:hypothetical protein